LIITPKEGSVVFSSRFVLDRSDRMVVNMKIERTKNATRNIIYGSILKIYQIAIPFVIRTAMLYLLGIEYLGLNGLFISILQVLNLTELGVSGAMVYSMYKPISEDDEVTICAMMKLYKIYYRIIGLIVLVLGLFLLPFIPKLISGEVPNDINIYVLYLLNLGASVLSYWLFAYKNSIVQAHQRIDVVSKISLITNTIQYGLQLYVLVFLRNYYFFLIIALTTQALTNVVTALIATKMYPSFKAIGKLEKHKVKEINQRVKALFTSKIGTVITQSVDTIVISIFLGLTVLAIYSNYFYIMSSVMAFMTIIFNSCTAGVGNSIITETIDKNYNDLKKITFIISWLAGVFSCCLLCLYQPFMEIWVGNQLMLDNLMVVMFCIYFYIYEVMSVMFLYKDAAGIWHKDRYRPIVTSFANLGMNLVMVQFMGIYGIVLSTILSFILIGMPWLIHNLFTELFKRKPYEYLKIMFKYTIITIVACIITYFCCSFINSSGLRCIIFRLIICMIVPNLIFITAYYNETEFKQTIVLAGKITGGKVKLLKL